MNVVSPKCDQSLGAVCKNEWSFEPLVRKLHWITLRERIDFWLHAPAGTLLPSWHCTTIPCRDTVGVEPSQCLGNVNVSTSTLISLPSMCQLTLSHHHYMSTECPTSTSPTQRYSLSNRIPLCIEGRICLCHHLDYLHAIFNNMLARWRGNISTAPKPSFYVLHYCTTWLLCFRQMFHLQEQFLSVFNAVVDRCIFDSAPLWC